MPDNFKREDDVYPLYIPYFAHTIQPGEAHEEVARHPLRLIAEHPLDQSRDQSLQAVAQARSRAWDSVPAGDRASSPDEVDSGASSVGEPTAEEDGVWWGEDLWAADPRLVAGDEGLIGPA
jgi:hypothetical protein